VNWWLSFIGLFFKLCLKVGTEVVFIILIFMLSAYFALYLKLVILYMLLFVVLLNWTWIVWYRRWHWKNMRKCWRRKGKPWMLRLMEEERWILRSLNPWSLCHARKRMTRSLLNWLVFYTLLLLPICSSKFFLVIMSINVFTFTNFQFSQGSDKDKRKDAIEKEKARKVWTIWYF